MPPAAAASPHSSRSHRSGPSRSSRSHSGEPPRQYARPYPESNTRGAPRDDRERTNRKRPAPTDDDHDRPLPPLPHPTDNDGDVGMRSDREQDGDDESSGASSPSLPHVAVKEEQLSEVEQSPSPPPTPAAGTSTRTARPLPPAQQRYAHPSGGPQTQFAPTPPASARRVSPPHIALPLLPHTHAGPSSGVTLPPLNFPPPSPSHAHHQHQPYQTPTHSQGYTHTEPMLARKRRRVTISGVAANSAGGAPPRPLHRTVLERAGSGYAHAQPQLPPGSNTGPTTPNPASGMVSPVVTPGFNMSSPGALDQVRDTIAIRMEQKALIEQRKNGGGLAGVPSPAAPLIRTTSGGNPAQAQAPRTQGSPSGQSTHLPANTLHAPTTSPSQGLAPPSLTSAASAPGQPSSHASTEVPPVLSAPPQPTRTLAHRRGKASTLTIHTPNTSISSSHGGSIGNGASLGLTGTDRPADAPGRGLAPNIEVAIRSAPPNVTRFDPNVGRPQPTHPAHRPPPQPTPRNERTVPIRRMHANSTAAPNTPSAPLAIVAPGQPLTLNAPAPPTSYIATPTRTQFAPSIQTPHHPHHPHLTPRATRGPGPASPPISRNAFMAFYDAYAEVHMLRAQMERMEREMDRRVEVAVRDLRDEVSRLRDEVRRSQEAFYRDGRDYPRGEPGPNRIRAGIQRSGSTSVHQSPMQVDRLPLPPATDKDRQQVTRDKSIDRLHAHPHSHPHPRPVLRKSPSVRVQSSMSPPSRAPSAGPSGEASTSAKARPSGHRRSKSPGNGNKSGSS
ncbi:hypothetical protein RhiJN_28679 [Ceratobasidium sp. AG-Ba]|nr:hypothetical protein RhiJN_28679 [Ceratobasidium sp. AG-Ba]